MAGQRFHRYPAQLGKLVDTGLAAEPTISRSTNAAERHLRLIVHRWSIDMAHAGADLTRDQQATGGVAGKHGGSQTVLTVIGKPDRIGLVLCPDQRNDRPKLSSR